MARRSDHDETCLDLQFPLSGEVLHVDESITGRPAEESMSRSFAIVETRDETVFIALFEIDVDFGILTVEGTGRGQGDTDRYEDEACDECLSSHRVMEYR